MITGELKPKVGRIWEMMWMDGISNPPSVMEQVTGIGNKGKDAIIKQEERLRAMSAADIEQQMPAFKACFDWIRSL